jgi:energy-coupling factor transporter ATP-binding protein EcfA2
MSGRAILTSGALHVPWLNKTLRTSPFDIRGGEFIHLFPGPDARVTEWLYLLGGLYDAFIPTEPAAENRLVRTQALFDLSVVRSLLFQGTPLYEVAASTRARQIGFVFRDSDVGIVGRTVEEDYLHATLNIGTSASRYLSAPRLFRYGLAGKTTRDTHVLSDGEKQRLNCATALDRQPDLVVADFTAANLDHEFVSDLLQWLEDFTSSGKAVIAAGLSRDELASSGLKCRHFRVDGEVLSEGAPDANEWPSVAEQRRGLQAALLPRKLGEKVLSVDSVQWRDLTPPTSFSLRGGEVAVLRGPNGSGKSTLASILGDRRPHREVSGKYTPAAETGVAVAFQSPRRTLLSSNVAEELPDRRILGLCGINNVDDVDPLVLPYGKQKLLACAVTLRLAGNLAILDEPTAGLCFEDKMRLVSLLNEWPTLAVLVISHDPALDDLGSEFQMGRD